MDVGCQFRTVGSRYLEVCDLAGSPVDLANAAEGIGIYIICEPHIAVKIQRTVDCMVVLEVQFSGSPLRPEAAIMEER